MYTYAFFTFAESNFMGETVLTHVGTTRLFTSNTYFVLHRYVRDVCRYAQVCDCDVEVAFSVAVAEQPAGNQIDA